MNVFVFESLATASALGASPITGCRTESYKVLLIGLSFVVQSTELLERRLEQCDFELRLCSICDDTSACQANCGGQPKLPQIEIS